MLEPLSHLDFDLAVFCTNTSRLPRGAVSDNTNRTVTFEAIRQVEIEQFRTNLGRILITLVVNSLQKREGIKIPQIMRYVKST